MSIFDGSFSGGGEIVYRYDAGDSLFRADPFLFCFFLYFFLFCAIMKAEEKRGEYEAKRVYM